MHSAKAFDWETSQAPRVCTTLDLKICHDGSKIILLSSSPARIWKYQSSDCRGLYWPHMYRILPRGYSDVLLLNILAPSLFHPRAEKFNFSSCFKGIKQNLLNGLMHLETKAPKTHILILSDILLSFLKAMSLLSA